MDPRRVSQTAEPSRKASEKKYPICLFANSDSLSLQVP